MKPTLVRPSRPAGNPGSFRCLPHPKPSRALQSPSAAPGGLSLPRAARETRSIQMPCTGGRSAALKCHASGRGNLGPLSVYARPVEHHASQALPTWFDSCLRHVVSNLHQAPLLTCAYEVRGHLSTGIQFATRNIDESAFLDPSSWIDLAKRSDERDPKALIYVRELASPGVAPVSDAEALERGSVGDCCEEPDSDGDCCDKDCPGVLSTETKYWGLVMQSPGEGQEGCYILKTESSSCGSCTCTHFSVSKVHQGMPFEAQLTNAWTTGI